VRFLPLQDSNTHRVFLFLLDRQAPARRSGDFLLHFLKVIITAIVCLVPAIERSTSPTRGVRRNAGKTSGGVLGRRLLVKQETKTPYYIVRVKFSGL